VTLRYLTDGRRHLVCLPYSIDNLHRMADQLGISRAWFHRGKDGKTAHYDLPKRRQAELEKKCEMVSPREIVRIARGA
jgi:Protein of unknown function (DUF4031)